MAAIALLNYERIDNTPNLAICVPLIGDPTATQISNTFHIYTFRNILPLILEKLPSKKFRILIMKITIVVVILNLVRI